MAEETVPFTGDPDSTTWAAERAGSGPHPLILIGPTNITDGHARRIRELFAAVESIASRPVTLRISGSPATTAPAHVLRAMELPPGMEPAPDGALNPYLLMTQGEIFQQARRAGLPAPVLTRTISCVRAPHSATAHCGHCPACLTRRAGLLAALGRDNTPYLTDAWNVADHGDTLRDREAVRTWLRRDLTGVELDLPSNAPMDASPGRLRAAIERARIELRRMFDTGGDRRSEPSAA
ncbi:7-cyano-7-deazaguanine synthase [Catenuloplanes japonicus]|uniref:7-cyano-7-deazaguanine synthase n=1 Tax=Catenuloplanes japonicus TaxID=33876 RepID=UPI0005257691|nr:7-cyano-7-deazaguanine synthase [Catenuloplanes japonicus]